MGEITIRQSGLTGLWRHLLGHFFFFFFFFFPFLLALRLWGEESGEEKEIKWRGGGRELYLNAAAGAARGGGEEARLDFGSWSQARLGSMPSLGGRGMLHHPSRVRLARYPAGAAARNAAQV